jgi:hypothetical protein
MKDKYYYICDGKINDLVVAPVAGSAVLNPIMACQDKKLRVLSEKGSEVISERHQKDFKKEEVKMNVETKSTESFTDVSFDDI